MQTERPQAPEPTLFAGAEPPAGGGRAFAITGALVIGLLTGFAGGFVVGQRGAVPEPRETAAVATPSETFTEAAIPEAAPAPAPEPVESFTEAAVPDPPVARTLPGSRGEPDRARPTSPAEVRAADAPSTLTFASRPSGAQVFLDGVAVGRTPLTVPNVKTGSHRVRLELAGHQTWATVVNVAPGSRQRVGASLDQ